MFLLLLLTTLALAAPEAAVPTEPIAAGGDLDAWRQLQARDLSANEALLAWQDFIVAWPTSPLSQVAWDNLVEVEATEGPWRSDPVIDAVCVELARSHEARSQALTRRPYEVAVATLNADGSPRTHSTPLWTVGLTGGVYGLHELGVSIGARATRGPLTAQTRVGLDAVPWAGIGVRGTLPPWGPFLELNADTSLRTQAMVGGRLDVQSGWWLEGSVGAERMAGKGEQAVWAPALRLEVARERSMKDPGRR